MPQITLKKKQIDELSAFMRRHESKTWFLAKDQGAYIGATGGDSDAGTFENCLFYFKGCDPNKDADFYDESGYKFGYDDFGEHFQASIVHKLADDPATTKMVVNVSATSIGIKSWRRKIPAAA